MSLPPNFTYPTSGRRVNPDGTVDVKCRICEKTICREPYRGFSTAICVVCQGEIEHGKKPEEIVAQMQKREFDEANAVYDDLGPAGFKVAGLGTRIKEVIEKIKISSSKRKREPLFAKKDIIK